MVTVAQTDVGADHTQQAQPPPRSQESDPDSTATTVRDELLRRLHTEGAADGNPGHDAQIQESSTQGRSPHEEQQEQAHSAQMEANSGGGSDSSNADVPSL